MKKIKNFIIDNYHIAALVLMFLSIGFVMMHNGYWLDDYRYMRPALCDWKVVFQFLKWHILNYNGRTIVHFFVILFLRYKYSLLAWRIICTAVICASCVFISKITAKTKEEFKSGCVLAALIIAGTIPYFWNLSVYWLCGSLNYLFPTVFLLFTMYVYVKKPESIWIYPLAFICGASTEQVGIMTVGFFVLIILDYALKNKKFNFKAFSYFVVSSVGYATILFSPGTFTRAGDQGELSAANLMTNFITILRKRWLDNLCIVVFLLAVNFFVVYWLVKFRNINKITSKINIPVSAAVSVLTVMNLLLKVFLVLMKFTGKPVSFSHSLNMVLFAVWIFYAFMYFASFLYAAVLIYKENGEAYPLIGFILGFGSQFMMIMAESSLYRTCVPGMFMFMIFPSYSVPKFAEDCRKSKNKTVKKYFKVEALILSLCAVACICQGAVGSRTLVKGDDIVDFPMAAMTGDEMKVYTDSLTYLRERYYKSDDWHEDFDITDFTWVF